jgi:hypothetical protein
MRYTAQAFLARWMRAYLDVDPRDNPSRMKRLRVQRTRLGISVDALMNAADGDLKKYLHRIRQKSPSLEYGLPRDGFDPGLLGTGG